MKILLLLLLFVTSGAITPQEKEVQPGKLNDNVNMIKKELQRRNFYLQPKKYHFQLLNKQRIQFILVKQAQMFATGIGVASDENNSGYSLAIYELPDSKDFNTKELIERFAVTDKIFIREIHDTSLNYLIEIEMSGTTGSNGSVVELVHGFSSIRLKAINKGPDSDNEANINAGLCQFGNCGIIHRVDWSKFK